MAIRRIKNATPKNAQQQSPGSATLSAVLTRLNAAVDDGPDKTHLLGLMAIRSPLTIDPATAQRAYIYDRAPVANEEVSKWADVDFQLPTSQSKVGHIVYEAVFCTPEGNMDHRYRRLVSQLLSLLTAYYAPCDDMTPPETGPTGQAVLPLNPADLERHANIRVPPFWFLLPDQLELISAFPDPTLLRTLIQCLTDAASNPPLDVPTLVQSLEAIVTPAMLVDWVFIHGGYTPAYKVRRRALFDALYFLYVMRRGVDVVFDDLLNCLRALHTIEALAVDEFIATLVGTTPAPNNMLLHTLQLKFPSLRGWDQTTLPTGFPLIASAADLSAYLAADPVIHPLFARLFYYIQPFNDLKPLGIGDLKIVKQWLVGYIPGEISDIHNIMMGESKARVHRRMEKTTQTFTSTSEQEQESTKDTQSTDRFELKRETDNIVKSDLSASANANVQYKGTTITANVSGGLAYNQSTSDDRKMAQNYAREVVSKAVSRVQSRIVQTRSVTQIFETRELNRHLFDNTKGTTHISGIYRWLDKEYKAQLYNFGKRLMFEVVLPEPAALYVESRLRAYEVSVDCPQPPVAPTLGVLTMEFGPGDIDENKFNQLRQQYDLAEFTFPAMTKSIEFIDSSNSQALLQDDHVSSHQIWYAKTFQCNVNAKGYQITTFRITGSMYFEHGYPNGGQGWKDSNLFQIYVDGVVVVGGDASSADNRPWITPNDDVDLSANPCLLTSDSVELVLGFQNATKYALIMSAEVAIGAQALLDWQTQVFNKVRTIRQKAVDDANNELILAYNTAMNTYRSRLEQLQSTVINDLLQGRSEAFNADVIRTELKRQCLSFLTKEFDANPSDGVLTDFETVGTRDVQFNYRQQTIHEDTSKGVTSVTIDETSPPLAPHTASYPLPMVPEARRKGRYIQFLEQAFEWQELSYIFYPYFWSTPRKWIELMNRNDATDPTLTAFLQAGAVRVLIPASPAYDTAVLHFLATREPWSGGPAPVIGDPLYLPIYEELKAQQDDLANAVPEGDPWTFRLPTSLVYLEGSSTPLPPYPSDAPPGG